jgi:DNA primase
MILNQYKADKVLKQHKDKLIELLFNQPAGTKKFSCPFHNDVRPSMKMYDDPERLTFHCFGCGKRYSVTDVFYKINYDKVPKDLYEKEKAYNELFEQLNLKEYKVILDKKDDEDKYSFVMNEFISKVLTTQLSKEAIEFLKSKGIYKLDIPHKYGIYMLKNKELKDKFIKFYASKLDINPDILNNMFIPASENRLIYTIYDENSKPVGFVSRKLLDTKQAKYINSGSSPIYNKSSILYGMHIAFDEQIVNATKHLIVVEGYNDAVAMWENNYKNTVALGGTALTNNMVYKIKQAGYNNIVFMLDGDAEGLKAMKRALLSVIAPSKLHVMIKLLPTNHDIDEVLVKYGPSGFNKLPVISPIDFLFKLKTSEDEIIDFLSNYPSDYMEYLIKQSKLLKDPYEILYKSTKKKLIDMTKTLQQYNGIIQEVTQFV